MVELARSVPVLKKRLERLLGKNRRLDKIELTTSILPALQEVGQIALIGGAIRDVARFGGDRFKSDLDFVIHQTERADFLKLMDRLGGKRNRFGGYALRFTHWHVDVWAIEDTWARTAGLRKVECLRDLVECTFFDWDAVLFDLSTNQIIAREGYLSSLEAAVLDLNLEENPNPRGALVRALRRGAVWKVRFGQRLTNFVRHQLERESWEDLVKLDATAFSYPVLEKYERDELMRRLSNEMIRDRTVVTEPFGTPEPQMTLPLVSR